MNKTSAAGASTAGTAAKAKTTKAPTPAAAAHKTPVAKPRQKRASGPAASASNVRATPKASSIKTRRVSKQDGLAALLLRDEGATLDQMIQATGWLPHTTRAALSGLRKKGYAVDSDKVDGVRTYRAVAPR